MSYKTSYTIGNLKRDLTEKKKTNELLEALRRRHSERDSGAAKPPSNEVENGSESNEPNLSTNEFLNLFFSELDGFIDVRAFKPNEEAKNRFFKTVEEAIAATSRWNADGFDCFFGVASRIRESGKKKDLESTMALWIDLDFKSDEERRTLTKELESFPLSPSVVVDSGHGLHGYWILEEPYGLRSEAARDHIEHILRSLAFNLGGDRASTDASRILRLPGTFNRKSDPVLCVVQRTSEVRYSVSDFDDYLVDEYRLKQTERPRKAEDGRIHTPGRREAIRSRSVVLQKKGLTQAELEASIRAYITEKICTESACCGDEDSSNTASLLEWVFKNVIDCPDEDPLIALDASVALDSPAVPWPSPLGSQAFHGLTGTFVRMVEPHTEADPFALLIQFLVSFGNMIGRGPHFRAEADRHYTNLFTGIVGSTSKGRKGTSEGRVKEQIRQFDEGWVRDRIQGGLSSGEGLIWAVRDEITKHEAVRKQGRVIDYQDIVVDPGVLDKRLMVIEPELASVLKVMVREGNTLSPLIRQAWDTGYLRSLTKNCPATATDAHISIIGHITRDELIRYLDRTEVGNGLANRFLWACVRRSKELPEGGRIEEVDFRQFQQQLSGVAHRARQVGEMARDEAARALWKEVYGELSEGKPGLLGAVTSRAEAQVMRIACIYALLDRNQTIGLPHLEAALEVWRYCFDSTRYIFGESLGDSVADELLALLRASKDGLTRTEIRDSFGRHKSNETRRALGHLQSLGLAHAVKRETGGRPAEYWLPGSATKATEATKGGKTGDFGRFSDFGRNLVQAEGEGLDESEEVEEDLSGALILQ